MGYRGKLAERQRARDLRAQSWTLKEIADELGVAKSSVSLWVRDVEFTPRPHPNANFGARCREPNALQRRKAEEIALMRMSGVERIGTLSDRDLLIAGTALYAGEGSKADGTVGFANTNPSLIDLEEGLRTAKHVNGCVSVVYHCSRTHRAIMGLVHALLDAEAASPA